MLNGKCKMVNGDDPPSPIASPCDSVQAKLEDTIELLHLWQNEALAYRHLAEALVAGEVTQETARRALAIAEPMKIRELSESSSVGS